MGKEKPLDPKREIWLSHSMLEIFQKCPRYFYWKYIRRLEKIQLNIPFLIGRIWHSALYRLFGKEQNILEKIKKEYEHERKQYMQLNLGVEDLKKLQEGAIVVQAMTKAYYNHYQTLLKRIEHVHNEKPFHFRGFENAVVVGQMDNILKDGKQRFLHEGKSTKGLTPDYVRSIQTRIQAPMYFFMNNEQEEDKFAGIMYDVIQKPTIRQGKKEQYKDFLKRIVEWYDDHSAENRFHFERIFKPVLSKNDVFNTVRQTLINIRERTEKEHFEQDFSRCLDGYECEMFDLCHKGEHRKEVMIQYKERERYQVGGKSDARHSPNKR